MPSPNESQACSLLPTKKSKINPKQKEILMNMTTQFRELAALVGLDWASQRHTLCLYDCATGERENSTLEPTPRTIAQWARGLQEGFGENKTALCREQDR